MRPMRRMPALSSPAKVLVWLLPILAILEPWQLHAQQPVTSGGGAQSLVTNDRDGNLRRSALPPESWQAQPNAPSAQRKSFPVVTASGSLPAIQDGRPTGAASNSSPSQNLRDVEAAPMLSSSGSKRTPLAPPSESTTGTDGPGNSSTLQMILSVGSSLMIVIGLFLGVAWCYRKTLRSSIAGGLPQQVVSVLGRTPLAARQQLVLVRFGSKLVLVSLVQGEARTISEITDPLEVDRLAGQCESSRPGSITQSFRSVLQQGAAT